MQRDEYCDIYDADRNFTGRTRRRGGLYAPGDFFLVVHVWIMNSRGEYLITRRAPEKKDYPLLWEAPGGSVLAGEDSLSAALRETMEETGIALRPEDGILFTTWRRPDSFADVWLFRREVSLDDFVPRPGETIAARLAAPREILAMARAGEFFRNAYMEEMFQFAIDNCCAYPGSGM